MFIQVRRKNGFSLIEAAIVLALVGAVIGGIWSATSYFYEEYKLNKTVGDISMMIKNTQKLISIRDGLAIGGPNVDISNTFIQAGLYPADWFKGSSVVNPFGGTAYARNYLNPPRFDVYITGLPYPVCRKLLVRLSAMASDGDLSTIRFLAVTNNGVWVYYTTFPISPESSQLTCKNINNIPSSIIIEAPYTRIN